MILLRASKRLQLLGDFSAASVIEADLDIVTTALNDWAATSFSTSDNNAVDQISNNDPVKNYIDKGPDVAALNGQMLDKLRGLGLDEWLIAFEGSERRDHM
ncbi:hypothetical protein L198_07509 [Cryptococcus wingfieldii CBS 7118]|uniref:Uncharacterized protein n=1 Tax=Cryptococcus wingfieldii CBS 7118 TaxID=1295528 RepID=A0A1E3IAP9_9TREE|nr:hypothetical protein L198_07509 [Cryptococcus wingfieldii CBS 7118]ODN85680.1 hypothetical protein L198_07509 [Cryptococcus wingfieldii CBS 7118]